MAAPTIVEHSGAPGISTYANTQVPGFSIAVGQPGQVHRVGDLQVVIMSARPGTYGPGTWRTFNQYGVELNGWVETRLFVKVTTDVNVNTFTYTADDTHTNNVSALSFVLRHERPYSVDHASESFITLVGGQGLSADTVTTGGLNPGREWIAFHTVRGRDTFPPIPPSPLSQLSQYGYYSRTGRHSGTGSIGTHTWGAATTQWQRLTVAISDPPSLGGGWGVIHI